MTAVNCLAWNVADPCEARAVVTNADGSESTFGQHLSRKGESDDEKSQAIGCVQTLAA